MAKADATLEEMRRAADTAQATEFIDRLEKGFDTFVSQGGNNLSGGQKQRITIARALIKNSPILILDDSASALDYATDANLRRAIKEKYRQSDGYNRVTACKFGERRGQNCGYGRR